MRSTRLFPTVLLAGLLLASWALAAAPVICPQCGHENPPENRECSHCGASLPEPKQESPDGDPAGGARALKTGPCLDAGVVEEEVRVGKARLAQGDFEVGRLLFENASALEMLTDPASAGRRGAEILDLKRQCEALCGRAQTVCPECGGGGKTMMRSVSLDGEVTLRPVAGKPCARCGGSGLVTQPAGLDERKFALGRAWQRYTDLQQARRLVPLGRAWVPRDVEPSLGVRQRATLMRALAAPCPACLGLGRVKCPNAKCTGGWVPCPNRKCENGLVEVEIKGSLVKGRLTRRETCKVCNGKGRVACPECEGKGSVLCEDCNGSGERPACTRCAGQGFVPCRRCGGTGQYRGAVCELCGGEGCALCSSCNGDGRRQ